MCKNFSPIGSTILYSHHLKKMISRKQKINFQKPSHRNTPLNKMKERRTKSPNFPIHIAKHKYIFFIRFRFNRLIYPLHPNHLLRGRNGMNLNCSAEKCKAVTLNWWKPSHPFKRHSSLLRNIVYCWWEISCSNLNVCVTYGWD